MNKCTKKNCPMNAETLNPDCDLKSCPYRTEISGDLISREEAINELKLAYFNKDLQSAKDDPCIVDAMTDWAIRTIKKLPSVEIHKRGKWMHSRADMYECSICGHTHTEFFETDRCSANFCWYCGADMRGDKNAD